MDKRVEAVINWDLWKNKKKITLWEAVLLSLDLDPKSKSYEGKGLNKALKKREIAERLQLLKDALKRKQDSIQGKSSSRFKNFYCIDIAEFAAWCIYIKLSIPDPLRDMAVPIKAEKTERGANEFGQRSKLPAPFKTVSTYKPSYTFPPEIKRRIVAEKPNWQEWKYTPQVQVWEACALSLDIEPRSIKKNPISWQTGPYADQLFEDESFQSENEKKEFKSRQRILLNNLNSKENSLWFSPCPNRPNLGEVSLPEFAAWCPSVEWPIPKELESLARKPDTTTVVKSENQDANLHLESKQESEETSTQDTGAAKTKRKKLNKSSIFGSELGGLGNDPICEYEWEDEEPELKIGPNKRPLINAWINFKAPRLHKAGDTIPTLAKKLWSILNKWGFESERSKLSMGSIERILTDRPAGRRRY